MTSHDSRFDDRLAAALDDVPIPPGLGERLLAALAPVALGEETLGKAALGEGTPSAEALRSMLFAAPVHRGRRRWMASAAAIAATLLISATSWWLVYPTSNADEDFASSATVWAEKLGDADWGSMKSAPRGFATPAALSVKPRGWQWATGLVGRQAVAFDVSTRPLDDDGRPRLRDVLLVIRTSAAGLPTAPPATPLTTGGRSIAVWQTRGQVCVLIVEGDVRHYRRLIRAGGAPVA